MFPILGRLLLGKVLTDERLKKAVMDELRELVNDPESEWDETALKIADSGWDALVTVLVGPK